MDEATLQQAVRDMAIPLDDDGRHDALLRMVGDAHYVLLGESSHGTHEFYRERARITQRLITEKGFCAVAVEGDWPHAFRVNRYVRGGDADADADSALGGFLRFPTWMWRNTEVLDFVGWLRAFNDSVPAREHCGFYGLDLYSMQQSMGRVLSFLRARDPALADEVQERYACFDRFGTDSQVYGLMTGLRGQESCAQAVADALRELQHNVASNDRADDAEEVFNARQNARLVRNAEAYYRSMYLSEVSSWNLRDQHMAQTLQLLEAHLCESRPQASPPKIVVWAHNSHVGDARATEMGWSRSELNLGQLVREQHGPDALLVGFGTYTGTVTAASGWGLPAKAMQVVPSLAESHEDLMHRSGLQRSLVPLSQLREGPARAFSRPRLERAIGVVYRPEVERLSHYVEARLTGQFDAWIHLDRTQALRPLEPGDLWKDVAPTREVEAPQTYPAGL